MVRPWANLPVLRELAAAHNGRIKELTDERVVVAFAGGVKVIAVYGSHIYVTKKGRQIGSNLASDSSVETIRAVMQQAARTPD
jgi:hypothetical protein